MDWAWGDNEEWNTVQQNVISQTVVWGVLLPFHWHCYQRRISPTKTSVLQLQPFLDFAAILAGFENPALKASVSPYDSALASRWEAQQGERAHISLDQDRLPWTFLISANIGISKEKNATVVLPTARGKTYLPKQICPSFGYLNWNTLSQTLVNRRGQLHFSAASYSLKKNIGSGILQDVHLQSGFKNLVYVWGSEWPIKCGKWSVMCCFLIWR